MHNEIIAIASDHAGFALKSKLVEHLKKNFYHTIDLGTNDLESVDYPDYASKVCSFILEKKAHYGILICGTGIGMGMAANHYKGIRAAVCTNSTMAKLGKAHNNANVLCIGSRVIGLEVALDCVDAFLKAEFEGGRHEIRVKKIESK